MLLRQKKLKSVILYQQEALFAFSLAIAWGGTGGVTYVKIQLESITAEQMNALALAFKVKRALPALQRLAWLIKSGDIVDLARALSTGTVPLLRDLNLLPAPVSDGGLNSLSRMLEMRALIPGCERLNLIPPNCN